MNVWVDGSECVVLAMVDPEGVSAVVRMDAGGPGGIEPFLTCPSMVSSCNLAFVWSHGAQ